MKPIVGIVCEYDPFHHGHRRQYELIGMQMPEARIVCIMSGCFTQRAMPAMHSVTSRAQRALMAGADVVLELPVAFSLRDAEHFAYGAVSILDGLGCVDYLSFGTEDDDFPMEKIAALLEKPTPLFDQTLKQNLDSGVSYARAQGEALHTCLGIPLETLAKPNNILGLCYLRALQKLSSKIKPLPVLRVGNYHATSLKEGGFPSATAIRKAVLEGKNVQANEACGYALPKAPLCRPDALDLVLLQRLRTMSKEQLLALPYCNEGLENRLQACAMKATSRKELLSLLKTKRYTYARLSRLCAHAMLGITQKVLVENEKPSYVRLIGFAKQSADLLKILSQGSLSFLTNATQGDANNPLYALDDEAYNLWALGAKIPAGLLYQSPMVVVSADER